MVPALSTGEPQSFLLRSPQTLMTFAVHHLDILGGCCGDTTSGLSLLTSFNFLHSYRCVQVFLALDLNGMSFYEWHDVAAHSYPNRSLE